MGDALKTLESLTTTALDSVRGYELAAEKATDPQLVSLLKDRASRRRQTVDKLNFEISRLGGERQTETSVTGDLHRKWVDITNIFANDNAAAASAVEEGEDYIAAKFKEAIQDGDWSPEALGTLGDAYREIQEGERLSDRIERMYKNAA